MNALVRRWWPQCALAGVLLAVLLYGAFAPLRYANRDQLFEIPKGTWARRMHGDKVEILPSEVRLTLGVKDVLLLRNHDDVPQSFGPVLIMPGQEFRLPFEQAGEYPFACTAHVSGQLMVRVVQQPDPGWDRLRWRTRVLLHALRYLPVKEPSRK